MLVSSANKIGVDLSLINFGRSFIKRRKSKGPKMEPCGTPCLTLAHVEFIAQYVVYARLANKGKDCGGPEMGTTAMGHANWHTKYKYGIYSIILNV
jgi:hypothetical protein